MEPTKSGVIGMIAAAMGRRRSDSVDDLVTGLRIAIRVDQPGVMESDFQTATTRAGKMLPLTHRYYLADAVFVVALEGDRELLESVAYALDHPVFPIFLGRRSCPPVGRLVLGVSDDSARACLESLPWQASRWWRVQQPGTVRLRVVREGAMGDRGRMQRDVPVSFDQASRKYAWRVVVEDDPVVVSNPDSKVRGVDHDPLSIVDIVEE